MIFVTAAFGASKTVNVLGYNIYVVEADGFVSAPNGSAVLVKKCSALELELGNLVLWSSRDEQPALGYISEIELSDGVYSFTLDENGSEHVVSELQIIGHAQFSSVFLGKVILFIKKPVGVFCIALLPCIALILYDIVRANAKSKPIPEFEPQVKNAPENNALKQQSTQTISVNSEGKAAYTRKKTGSSAAANQVLFELVAKQRKASVPTDNTKVSKPNPGAIPEGFSGSVKPNAKPEQKAETGDYPKSPRPAALNEYAKFSENPKKPNVNPDVDTAKGDKTAELPTISKRDNGDAFFVQTAAATGKQARSVPQIGKSTGKSERGGEGTANSTRRPSSNRKSSQILASKKIDDLISDDDDDYRDNKRISDSLVDDILSDLNKK